MKHFIVLAILMTIILVAVFVGTQKLNSTLATIVVEQVEPGVKCAKAVTNQGVALSCWKE